MDDKAKHVEAEGDAGPTTTVVGSHGCELTIRDSTSRDRRVVSLSSSSSLPLPLLSSPSPLPSSAPVASAPSSIFAAPMPVPMPMPMHVPATSSATVSGAGGGGAELLPFPQFVSLPPFVVRGVGPTGNVASHNDSNEARQPWRDDTPKTKNNKDDDDDDHNNNEDYDDDDDVVDVEEGVGGRSGWLGAGLIK
ncbi:hypothetical protein Pelo_8470 [Pelomyxa schiedti]|nr:hypothetical protein Pelo_8470 [Pelomyxa schiedti]